MYPKCTTQRSVNAASLEGKQRGVVRVIKKSTLKREKEEGVFEGWKESPNSQRLGLKCEKRRKRVLKKGEPRLNIVTTVKA